MAGEGVKESERGGKARTGTNRSRKGEEEESATEPMEPAEPIGGCFLAGIGWNQRAGWNSTCYKRE